ncbi:Ribonuclease 7 [Heterocephalus glaber]|uniref:pancreatic ribonuclease n=1 Tax=Heterocephalus glaber TaxID=10181 RepID=G5BFW1_HETGA|nr:ribonuclease 7 [Heterocephalus glaber]XP_021100234.1 ribonuclease 7 [Heterocephalus glaber]XP_021100235.1 ribonuclease 7 [Heterocephalus glaber]XP_021100236.1 ribonuclease 7 [Heterocephalus glaber]XP_021100237.1 ribonuclease 7 [Heterocephalus glaber]XP_021100238.1 ribonuclease 7 [Heterocephalus glaber]XP_021100239.1 ribonuclease 7 [Heterocephalus glaber]XP_021100240.1 ribonuclease 7 [Heterocephalus glaber]EHB08172.1 Ribonuclease 7 [Heterocephalus glaber]
MTPARPRCFSLLLLLLLGLWVAEIPVSAKPRNMTSAQWFETQHVQPKPQACNPAMDRINKYTKHCKPLNSFLHASFSNVAATCQTPSIPCKNGHKNCHKSPKLVSLTTCKHASGRYPNCRYKEKHLNASEYIVACDPPQSKDSGKFHLVPVHLEKVI